MDRATFMTNVESFHSRDKRVLMKKADLYSDPHGDRLEQFHQVAAIQKETAESAVMGMVSKHFTALADMAKAPQEFRLEQFNERTTDIRNYMYLLDALLRDRNIPH